MTNFELRKELEKYPNDVQILTQVNDEGIRIIENVIYLKIKDGEMQKKVIVLDGDIIL